MKLGSDYIGNGKCEFTLWSPKAEEVALRIVSPAEEFINMQKINGDYWKILTDAIPGTKYYYILNNTLQRSDPASQYQPEGINGPSQVIDHTFYEWEDEEWKGIPAEELIIYEIHTGTFSKEGTFKGIADKIDYLKELGITAIELMPLSQFSGSRNWGYDGVFPFAPANCYGSPDDLKDLINECHLKGIAVINDVVYNHFGPEGNYFSDFGPYFNDKYKTPWGPAINYDGAYSDEVRYYYFENAIYWLENFHFDALRLDAIHAIYDMSAKHFLRELCEKIDLLSDKLGMRKLVIAESDLNDTKIIRTFKNEGYGCDAQWNDDFHHSLHTLLTGEITGYHRDFGRTDNLAEALRNGFVYNGKYSSYRKRKQGNSSAEVPPKKFIIYSQNHDQIGNRCYGERLSSLVEFEALKVAAGAVLLSSQIPMLFMGEEYAEDNPFLYFVSHEDLQLAEAIRNGRQEEFSYFNWSGDIPDPQGEETFLKSKLDWHKRENNHHNIMLSFYKKLIELRKSIPLITDQDKSTMEITASNENHLIRVKRRNSEICILMMFNFNSVNIPMQFPTGSWNLVLDSSAAQWNGTDSNMPQEISTTKETFSMNRYSFCIYRTGVD